MWKPVLAFIAGTAFVWILTPTPAPQESRDVANTAGINPTFRAEPTSANVGEIAPVENVIPDIGAELPARDTKAGQRRALNRALDEFAKNPTEAAVPPAPELAAELAAKIRGHFLEQGDQP